MKLGCSLLLFSLLVAASASASAQTFVNLSPAEGWTVQLSAPVLLDGQGSLPTVGLNLSRTFALGQSLGWKDGAERVRLGIGATAFAPLNFQQLYLGASAGVSHYTVFEHFMLDYGLRYAPLVQVNWAGNNSTGYNGLLANLGFHYALAPNTWMSLGLQTGAYLPLGRPDASALWVFQPIFGVNTAF